MRLQSTHASLPKTVYPFGLRFRAGSPEDFYFNLNPEKADPTLEQAYQIVAGKRYPSLKECIVIPAFRLSQWLQTNTPAYLQKLQNEERRSLQEHLCKAYFQTLSAVLSSGLICWSLNMDLQVSGWIALLGMPTYFSWQGAKKIMVYFARKQKEFPEAGS